eukprot:1668068-Prymnesium_polylepis.1
MSGGVTCATIPPPATPSQELKSPALSDDGSSGTIWRAQPSMSALTAACVAGEARTLVYRSVQTSLHRAVLEPLRADSFLVLSPVHTGKWYDVSAYPLPPITHLELLSAAQHLQAVSLIVANDSSPLFRAPSLSGLAANHLQRAMVLRFKLCLDEIHRAERWRGKRHAATRAGGAVSAQEGALGVYRWVVRTRPDSHYTCALCVPSLRGAEVHGWAVFYRDFVALLSRDAAETALGAPNGDIATCSLRSRAPAQRREEWVRSRAVPAQIQRAFGTTRGACLVHILHPRSVRPRCARASACVAVPAVPPLAEQRERLCDRVFRRCHQPRASLSPQRARCARQQLLHLRARPWRWRPDGVQQSDRCAGRAVPGQLKHGGHQGALVPRLQPGAVRAGLRKRRYCKHAPSADGQALRGERRARRRLLERSRQSSAPESHAAARRWTGRVYSSSGRPGRGRYRGGQSTLTLSVRDTARERGALRLRRRRASPSGRGAGAWRPDTQARPSGRRGAPAHSSGALATLRPQWRVPRLSVRGRAPTRSGPAT